MPSLRRIRQRRKTHHSGDMSGGSPSGHLTISMRERGRSVFGSVMAFERWLDLPLPVFAGRRPRDLLMQSTGARKVYEMLMRIEYGIY